MKAFISTTFYGFFNHILALTLIASPWIFGFANTSSAALLLPMYIGWLQLIMAIFADNKLGFLKVFPMSMHNVNDVIMGSFLMCSPWVYDFHSTIWIPQVLFGGALFILDIFTQGSPLLNKEHKLQQGGLTSTDSL